MEQVVTKILFTHEEIVEACKKVASVISHDYEGKCPMIVGILNGSIPFVAEMVKYLKVDCKIEFLQAKTYFGKTTSSGKIVVLSNNISIVEDQDVIICDDIFDSGLTLKTLKEMVLNAKAKSVKCCTLLNKESAHHEEGITLDYYGLKVENQFVVGFGLDYNDLYRNLPYIGIFNQELINKK